MNFTYSYPHLQPLGVLQSYVISLRQGLNEFKDNLTSYLFQNEVTFNWRSYISNNLITLVYQV